MRSLSQRLMRLRNCTHATPEFVHLIWVQSMVSVLGIACRLCRLQNVLFCATDASNSVQQFFLCSSETTGKVGSQEAGTMQHGHGPRAI